MEIAKDFWNNSCRNDELKSPADIMIEFTKLHVEAALKAASQTKLEANYHNTGVDEERYPNDKSLIYIVF